MSAKDTSETKLKSVRETVLSMRARGKRCLDAETKRRILTLHDEGLPFKQLSEHLNVAQSVLYAWDKKRKTRVEPCVLKVSEQTTSAAFEQTSSTKPNIEIRWGSFYLCTSKQGW